MRIKLTDKYKHREKRTVTRFALFPRKLKDEYLVWLEKYYEEQQYDRPDTGKRGRWRRGETWSIVTEKRNLLNMMKE